MEPLKIGIAGAGGIAQRNAREAAASGAAKIVGVFDVNNTTYLKAIYINGVRYHKTFGIFVFCKDQFLTRGD